MSLALFLDGDKQFREQAILDSQQLVRGWVASALKRMPKANYLAEDLQSEATLAVIESIDGLCGVGESKGIKTLDLNVQRRLRKLTTNDRCMGMAPATHTRRRRSESQPPESFPNMFQVGRAESKDDNTLQSIMECCQNDVERQIVSLRAEGYSVVDTADRVNISKSMVYSLLKEIEARYAA